MEIRSPANQLFPPKFMVSFVATDFVTRHYKSSLLLLSTQFTQISCWWQAFSLLIVVLEFYALSKCQAK